MYFYSEQAELTAASGSKWGQKDRIQRQSIGFKIMSEAVKQNHD
jgi:hypothetical protein